MTTTAHWPPASRPGRRRVPVLVLVFAVLALAGSVAWAATRANDGVWRAGYGTGMMGGRAGPMYGIHGDGRPVTTIGAARARAQVFADELAGNLRAGEVMQFTRNFYVELVDSTGRGATEVLVDPDNGGAGIEYGPAMMWNTRYGMGGGMNRGRSTSGRTVLGPEEAGRIAADWLRERDGYSTAGRAEKFPGYYTLHVLRDGHVTGMLSVHAVTGAVWYHTWHGRFVAMSEG